MAHGRDRDEYNKYNGNIKDNGDNGDIYDNGDNDSIEDSGTIVSPKDIAMALFTQGPKDPCSHLILAHQDGSDTTYIFEILITILLEALDILSNGLENADLKNFTADHITCLDPWFKSIGFTVSVNTYNKDNRDGYKDYYCRAMVRTPLYESFFEYKNVNKNYHFMLNGDQLQANRNKTNLKELSCIFADDNDLIYKISFDYCSLNK